MALMLKEDGEVLTKVDLVHGVVAMSSFVNYDPHNKIGFAGQLDAPSPLVEDSQCHHLTIERELRPMMKSVERGRRQVPVN